MTGRGSKSLILTEAGRILYKKAKYMCSLEDMAKNEIESRSKNCDGTLCIGFTDNRMTTFAGNLFYDFCKAYPKIKYFISEGKAANQVPYLLSGITELGILNVPLQYTQELETLFCQKEKLQAVYHKDYSVKAPNDKFSLQKLSCQTISISAECWRLLQNTFMDNNMCPNIFSVSTSRDTALQWALEKQTVAVIPLKDGADLPQELVCADISGLSVKFTTSIVKARKRPLSYLGQKFVAFAGKSKYNLQRC